MQGLCTKESFQGLREACDGIQLPQLPLVILDHPQNFMLKYLGVYMHLGGRTEGVCQLWVEALKKLQAWMLTKLA